MIRIGPHGVHEDIASKLEVSKALYITNATFYVQRRYLVSDWILCDY